MATASGTLTTSEVIEGILFEWNPQGILYAKKYVGERDIPQDIKRRRRQVYDIMRRMGSPVLVKHMWNADDVERGEAKASENFSDVYGQTRHDDPLSHGVGYVSVETADDEWVLPNGTLVKATTQPEGGVPAPKYRGYGQGYLIWVIQPDVAQDLFKVDETGVLIKVQNASIQAPWFPEINDNDLLIDVEIDRAGNIVDTFQRYVAKMSSPVSLRGYGDRNGRREYTEDGGNRYVVNQTFETALIPDSDKAIYRVEADR